MIFIAIAIWQICVMSGGGAIRRPVKLPNKCVWKSISGNPQKFSGQFSEMVHFLRFTSTSCYFSQRWSNLAFFRESTQCFPPTILSEPNSSPVLSMPFYPSSGGGAEWPILDRTHRQLRTPFPTASGGMTSRSRRLVWCEPRGARLGKFNPEHTNKLQHPAPPQQIGLGHVGPQQTGGPTSAEGNVYPKGHGGPTSCQAEMPQNRVSMWPQRAGGDNLGGGGNVGPNSWKANEREGEWTGGGGVLSLWLRTVLHTWYPCTHTHNIFAGSNDN